MRHLRSALILLMFVFSTTVEARRLTPVINLENVSIVSDKKISSEQVRRAILSAAKTQGWRVVADAGKGSLVLRKHWSSHAITSQVKYSSTQYSILYKDSANMNYTEAEGTPSIHPYYNRYVEALSIEIRHHIK